MRIAALAIPLVVGMIPAHNAPVMASGGAPSKTFVVNRAVTMAVGEPSGAEGPGEPGTPGVAGALGVLARGTDVLVDAHQNVSVSLGQAVIDHPGDEAANIAAVFSDCRACSGVAMAIQVVFALRDPGSSYQVTNHAVSWDRYCPGCENFAGAAQLVIWSNVPLELDPAGTSELGVIQQHLSDAAWAGVSLTSWRTRFDQAVAEVRSLLGSDLEIVPGVLKGLPQMHALSRGLVAGVLGSVADPTIVVRVSTAG
jgi:hypothetical protein